MNTTQGKPLTECGELKPCPFCGGAPVFEYVRDPGNKHDVLYCPNFEEPIGCCSPCVTQRAGETREEMAARWNTRTKAQPQGAPSKRTDKASYAMTWFAGSGVSGDSKMDTYHARNLVEYVRSLEAQRSASAVLPTAESAEGEIGWLIEWPACDNMPARWWHPRNGWMLDANKAVRFSRKADGEAYRNVMHISEAITVTEHIWCDGEWDAAKPTQPAGESAEELLMELYQKHPDIGERERLQRDILAALKDAQAQPQDGLREALNRQCDNMAFVLNHIDTRSWYEKLKSDLETNRKALAASPMSQPEGDV